MEQFRLDLAPGAHAAPRKPHVRGYLNAPFCDACTASGRTKRDKGCKECRRLYQAAWHAANPGRAEEAARRYQERQRAKQPERVATKAVSFAERYHTDPTFREAHKAKSRAWDAAHPEYVVAKRQRQAERRVQGYRRLSHPPIVYFIRSYLTGLVKIGTTTRLAARLIDFRCALPGRLEVLGVMDGSHALESQVHALFYKSRVDREWFAETPALIDFIKTNACDKHPDIGGVSLAPGEGYIKNRGRKKAERR